MKTAKLASTLKSVGGQIVGLATGKKRKLPMKNLYMKIVFIIALISALIPVFKLLLKNLKVKSNDAIEAV